MKQRWTIPLGVALVAVLAHVETLGYWFVATDTLTLTVSSRARTVEGVMELFTQPLMAGTRFTNVALFYRPLASLSHAFDYALWGLDPTGYHLTNLILHGVAVALSALVVTEITDSETGSLAGFLVAAHPLTAEVVPSVARRHSVLMSIFLLAALLLFVRGRRRDSRRLLAGSVVAYALALLSKELALLFPGLVFAWVALDELADGRASTDRDIVLAVRTAFRALGAFVLTSVAYVGVRVTALGGLGGYHKSRPLTFEAAIDLTAKYVLSLTYPRDLVTAALETVGRGPLLALGGLLGVFAIAMVGFAVRRPRQRMGALALAVVAGGMGSLPLAAVLAGRFGVGEVLLGYPAPHSVVVGGLFVASLAVGALIALPTLLSRRHATGSNLWQPIAFFAVWFVSPVALFLLSGGYTIRNGYLFLSPTMGIVALVLVTAIRSIDLDTRGPDVSAALTVIAAVFVLSLVITSPLVHDYDGWQTAGEVNRVTLTTLEDALVDAPTDTTVWISGMPQDVRTQMEEFPRVQSVGYARVGTVESWLRLRDPGTEISLRVSDTITLPRPPTDASVTTERKNGTIRVGIHYAYR